MIVPSLALALAIIGWPIVDLAWTSTQEVSRFGRMMGFAGWENYANVFADPLFWSSLWRTGIWTVCVVLGTLLISFESHQGKLRLYQSGMNANHFDPKGIQV